MPFLLLFDAAYGLKMDFWLLSIYTAMVLDIGTLLVT